MTQLEEFFFDLSLIEDKPRMLGLLGNLVNLKQLNLSGFSLKKLPDFVLKMQNLEFLDLNKTKITALPDALGDLPKLETLILPLFSPHLINHVWEQVEKGKYKSLDTEYFPKTAEELAFFNLHGKQYIELNLSEYSEVPSYLFDVKNLSELCFIYKDKTDSPKSEIKEIPDLFHKLKHLSKILFRELPSLESLPNSFYECNTLQEIWLKDCPNLKVDYVKLSQLPNLRTLVVSPKDNDIEFIPLFKKIKILQIKSNTCYTLPEDMKNLKGIKYFSTYYLPNLNLEDVVEKLPYVNSFSNSREKIIPTNLWKLKYLTSVYLYDTPIKEILEFVKKTDRLEVLHFDLIDYTLPSEITLLNKIQEVTIVFPFMHETYYYPNTRRIKIPLDFVLLDFERIVFENSMHYLDNLIKKAKIVQKMNLANDEQRKVVFAFLIGYFDEIKDYLHSSYETNSNWANCSFYIFGKPTFGTFKELHHNLRKEGAKISKKLDETVTHIFITGNFSEKKFLDVFFANKPFILEDYYKTKVLSEGMPYLMKPENQGMSEQITSLLKSYHNPDNLHLLLELIESGGADKVIVSYLLVLSYFHHDIIIKKKAHKLFRKFASMSLQIFLKNNWSKKDEDHTFSTAQNIFIHQDLDFFACVLAKKVVEFQDLIIKGRFSDYYKELELKNISIDKLTPSFKHLDFLDTFIFKGTSQKFDWESSYQYVEGTKFERIHISNIEFSSFPVEFLALDTITNLWFDGEVKRYSGQQTFYKMPKISKNENLKGLMLKNVYFDKPENWQAIAAGLTYLNLYQTNLGERLDMFSQSVNLTSIRLSYLQINKLTLDFSLLTNLESLGIEYCPIEILNDEFYNATKLNDIYINNTNLKQIPYSLICEKEKDEEPEGNSIGVGCSKINSFAKPKEGFQHLPLHKWRVINLRDNDFDKIPAFLLDFENTEIYLNNNPIKTIPLEIAKSKIGSINLIATLIEEIPMEVFQFEGNISVSNEKANLIFPNLDEIPNYKGDKSFSDFCSNEEDMKLIREKQIKE